MSGGGGSVSVRRAQTRYSPDKGATAATPNKEKSKNCEFGIVRQTHRGAWSAKAKTNPTRHEGPAFSVTLWNPASCLSRRRLPWYPPRAKIRGTCLMSGGPAGAQGDANAPRVQIVAQYTKDLSFENPGAPGTITNRPNIDLSVDLQARRMDGPLFEVELKLRINAKSQEDKPVFLLELVYAGLF